MVSQQDRALTAAALLLCRTVCTEQRRNTSLPVNGNKRLLRLAEMDHGVVELSAGHRRLRDRMCALGAVGVEHEV